MSQESHRALSCVGCNSVYSSPSFCFMAHSETDNSVCMCIVWSLEPSCHNTKQQVRERCTDVARAFTAGLIFQAVFREGSKQAAVGSWSAVITTQRVPPVPGVVSVKSGSFHRDVCACVTCIYTPTCMCTRTHMFYSFTQK